MSLSPTNTAITIFCTSGRELFPKRVVQLVPAGVVVPAVEGHKTGHHRQTEQPHVKRQYIGQRPVKNSCDFQCLLVDEDICTREVIKSELDGIHG